LCRVRRKLLDRGLERTLFERLVRAAREARLITKDATQLLDSSHVLGAAGARDTYALIRGGIRKLLRALGYTPTRRAELSDRLGWYLDLQAPEKLEIDWSDAEARADHLKEIVEDAREALGLADRATAATPAAAEAASLLEKIVADDVEERPPPKGPKRKGRPPKKERASSEERKVPKPGASWADEHDDAPRLRQGVAKDRILSVVDPQMRVGHKSQRQG
jgi:hypothetical protein